MAPFVRIRHITPQEFWRCGYRWGYDDAKHNRPHMVDGDAPEMGAQIIPLRRAQPEMVGELVESELSRDLL